MNDKQRCCVHIFGKGYGFRGSPCSKPVRVTVDGKHYCAIHDPAKVAARRAKAQAEANARQEARNAHYEARKETERKAACFGTLVAALESMISWANFRSDWLPGEEPADHPIAKARVALKEVKP